MCLFKKGKSNEPFFEEDSLDNKFDEMMSWIKNLSRRDYNRIKKAMDNDYEAYQILHGIEPVDDLVLDDQFMIHPEEGK